MDLKLFIYTIIFSLILSNGCSKDPEEISNKLYVGTYKHMQKAVNGAKTFTESYKHYKNARNNINRIINKYPQTGIAVKLTSGELKVFGLDLQKFKNLDGHLRLLSDAEKSPNPCALLICNSINDMQLKNKVFSYFINKSFETGDVQSALDIWLHVLDIDTCYVNSEIIFQNFLVVAFFAINPFESPLPFTMLPVNSYKYLLLEKNDFNSLLNSEEDRLFTFTSIGYSISSKFQLSRECINLINNKCNRACALAFLASTIESQDKEQANNLLSSALKLTLESKDEAYKLATLSYIAGKYGEIGNQKEKQKILDDVTKAINKIQDPVTKFGVISYLSSLYSKNRNITKSDSLLSYLPILAQKIKDNRTKAMAMAYLAKSYAKSEKSEDAKQFLSLAYDLISKEKIAWIKYTQLAYIAPIYEKLGYDEKADQLLFDALNQAKNIKGNTPEKAITMFNISVGYNLASLKIKDKEKKVLQSIVNDIISPKQFWQKQLGITIRLKGQMSL